MGSFRFITNDGKEVRMRSEELHELIAIPILDKYYKGEITHEQAISMAADMLDGFPTSAPEDARLLSAAEFLFPEAFDSGP